MHIKLQGENNYNSMKLGKLDLFVISAGKFWLDGGAMFGVVPKSLWEKKHPSDEKNRILMETNCPLIHTSDGKWVLVDTGNGTKFSAKENDWYNIESGNPLEKSLQQHQLTPNNIDIVILSHLHFDHAGGGTRIQNEKIVPTFPNAKYFIQKSEWLDASNNRGIMTKTYLKDNFLPLKEHGVLELIDGNHSIHPEIEVLATGGHTRGHQAVIFKSEGEKSIYFGDLIPMASHLPYPYIMAYDTFPLETLEKKKELLPQIIEEKWLVIWDHDPYCPIGYVNKNDKGRFIFKELDNKPKSHCH